MKTEIYNLSRNASNPEGHGTDIGRSIASQTRSVGLEYDYKRHLPFSPDIAAYEKQIMLRDA
jgi:hypothetical protein